MPSPSGTGSLDSTVSLVFGGTKGVGRAVSRRLARMGPVFANYAHDEVAAEALATEAKEAGLPIDVIRGDIGTKAGLDAVVDEVRERAPRIDVVVFAAVDAYLEVTADVTEDRWHQAMATNVAPFLWAGQRLPEIGARRLIGVTSPFSHRYAQRYSVVGPSKAALESLVVYLAVEHGPAAVTVNAVSGGLIDTELMRRNVPQAQIDKTVRGTPLGRLGQPEDIASLIAWMASEEAAWMTGQVVTMDGGYFLR